MSHERVPFSYRALQVWARSAIHVVYRRAEVTGLSNIPTDRPAILAANHSNALADIAVIVAKMPRFPQFLAAASWWKSPPAATALPPRRRHPDPSQPRRDRHQPQSLDVRGLSRRARCRRPHRDLPRR